MQPTTKKTLFYTRILSSAGLSAKKARHQENQSAKVPSLFPDIHTLPLDRFIRCVCDDDLGALIIEGENPPVLELRKQLSDATDPEIIRTLSIALETAEIRLAQIIGSRWEEIFLDYLDMCKDDRIRFKVSLEKEIAILGARLQQIETCLFTLTTIYVKDLVDHLHGMGYTDFKLDPTDLRQYEEDLNGVKDRSREMKIDRDLKVIELEELIESAKKEGSRKADRISFTNILSRVATYKGVAVIRSSEITVSEFVAMFNEYLDHIKALKTSKKPKA